jgi:hypothetical protein
MDARLKPFKSWEPNGNYYVSQDAQTLKYSVSSEVMLTLTQIHDVDYSPDGQSLLVISGTLQPKMYNRNGEEGSVALPIPCYFRSHRTQR